jgi:hypothetical protein
MTTTNETLYGSLRLAPLAWGTSTATDTTFTTATSTNPSLVSLIGSDGVVGYEGRLAVVRGGLGNGARWESVRGIWAGTSAPTATFAGAIAGVSGTNVGILSPFPVSSETLPGTIAIRDSSGNLSANNFGNNGLFFWSPTVTAYSSFLTNGSCYTTSTNTGTLAPALLAVPLGTWSGSGTITSTSIMSITGRGTIAVARNAPTATGGASIEVELRAVYRCSGGGSSAWTLPDFQRLGRFGDADVLPTNTQRVTLQMRAGTVATDPTLFVSAIGDVAPNVHYWSGIFNLAGVLV